MPLKQIYIKKFKMLTVFCCLQLTVVDLCYGQTLSFNGQNYFINGANIPWNKYGSDIGTHYLWGALYDSVWFENTFSACESNGINCVRIWIHCDGRTSPEFDTSGSVTGLDTNFFSNLDDLFARAAKHNLLVMPCLWSAEMTRDTTVVGNIYSGRHSDLIRDTVDLKKSHPPVEFTTPQVKALL